MARPIILALEEYEGNDPNNLDFSDFEPVMGSEVEDLAIDLDNTIDAVDAMDTHTEIVDIIATEGVGNRPQIAAIALSALEQRLFGSAITVPRVGTESRTRIATEGKNVFVRVWEAISKFFKKLWERIKSIFTGDKKEKIKKKAKQVKEADVERAVEVIKVMSSNNTAKQVVQSEEPITPDKVKAVVDEVKEKVKPLKKLKPKKDKVTKDKKVDNEKEVDVLIEANLKATKMLSGNINLFAGDKCKGPKEIIEGIDDIVKLFAERNENEILKSLSERVDYLLELGEKENGYDEYMTGETKEKAIKDWNNEVNYKDNVIKNILIPGYGIDKSFFERRWLKPSDLVRLNEVFIRRSKPDFYEQYLYILNNKDLISSKIEIIADFNDRVKNLNDAIKEQSDRIDKLKNSIKEKFVGSEDPVIAVKIQTIVVDEFKEMLGTLKFYALIANAYIAFTDAIHNCIMTLDGK